MCLQSADVAVRPAGGVGESRKHSREAGVGPTGDRGGSGRGGDGGGRVFFLQVSPVLIHAGTST